MIVAIIQYVKNGYQIGDFIAFSDKFGKKNDIVKESSRRGSSIGRSRNYDEVSKRTFETQVESVHEESSVVYVDCDKRETLSACVPDSRTA
ncbi:hypothetical protein TNCV_1842401 [Trichonephila clavipes]|nr:hypothetical protein TNCV_1842401 [Trichonephila clavipes]